MQNTQQKIEYFR